VAKNVQNNVDSPVL